MSDLRTRAKEIIETAQEKPVYLLRRGEPVGAVVSVAMLELLQEVLVDRYVARGSEQRLHAIHDGEDRLVDEHEFWSRATSIVAGWK